MTDTAQFVGVAAGLGPIKQALKKLEEEAIATTQRDARRVFHMLLDITPVWSGETVRNFAVGVGKKPAGQASALGGPPGRTNDLPLGREPNRAANEAAAVAEMESAVSSVKKLSTFFIDNLVEPQKWALIESGKAPGPPGVNRGGGGHTGLALQMLRQTGNWK